MLTMLWGCGTDDIDSDVVIDEPVVAQAEYVGSEACQSCHPAYYSDVFESGHPYKLNKVVNNQVPTYPFSDITGALERVTDGGEDGRLDLLAISEVSEGIPTNGNETDNELGTPADYSEVTYVIGGFGWKARFLDADGFIVTGDTVQYNLEDDSMSGYHNDEANKVYNCGNCHTTGWKRFDETLNPNRQDDLPGMDGTFTEAGIGCESCHGAGSLHADNPTTSNIVRNATARTTEQFLADDMAYGLPVACGECHTRDGEKDYPSYLSNANKAGYNGDQGGRIISNGKIAKHHEQYDELLGLDINADGSLGAGGALGKHLLAGVTCNSCHDPHKSTKYDAEALPAGDALKLNCLDCHAEKDSYTIAVHDTNCLTCHMPKLAKSAIWTEDNAAGMPQGDISSHIFKIDLSKTAQLTDDNGYVYPWITPAFSCGNCHTPDELDTRVGNLPNYGGTIHTQ